jgi:hypothetical protein
MDQDVLFNMEEMPPESAVSETSEDLPMNYPQISSDLYEQNLSRDDLPQGITPEQALAVDTAFMLKEKNPGLFKKDEDPYRAIALGQASFIPEAERGKVLSDAEILMKYLRNANGEPMREGSFAQGFAKEMPESAGALAGTVAGAKLGYKLQAPIPPAGPWAIGAKFLIPIVSAGVGSFAGAGGVDKIREYFFGDEDLVKPGEGRSMERTGETAAMMTTFIPLPFAMSKEALNFGAKQYLSNLADLKTLKLEQTLSRGPLPEKAFTEAVEQATSKGPLYMRGISKAEDIVGQQGRRAAEKPIKTLVEEGSFAAGATGGRYLSEQYADGEFGLGAEIAGGVGMGLLVPVVGGKTLYGVTHVPQIWEATKKFGRRLRGKEGGLSAYFKSSLDDEALAKTVDIFEEKMRQAGEDPELVAAAIDSFLNSSPITQVTSGIAAQSPTLLNIERNLSTLFPDLGEKGQASIKQAIDDHQKLIAMFSTTKDAEGLAAVERSFQASLERAFVDQLDAQAKRVLTAAEKVGSGESDTAVGLALQKYLGQALSAARAKERTLYSNIPETEITIFRDFASGDELGEVREVPNLFDFVDALPTSRAALRDLPKPLQTEINFVKEVLEDSGIDVSQLGKRGAGAGVETGDQAAKIQARLDRLAQQRQTMWDNLPVSARDGMNRPFGLNAVNPNYPGLTPTEKITAINSDIAQIDELIEGVRVGAINREAAVFPITQLRDIRKFLVNRLSTARAENDLATVGERVVQRSEDDVRADEIIDLRALIDELRASGEPITIASTKLSEMRTRALAAERELSSQGKYSDARLASRFASLVDQDLTGALGDIGNDSVRASLTAARAYSRAFNDVFTRASAPSMILGSEKTGASKVSPEELVRTLFSGRSDKTLRTAREISRVGRFLQDNVNPDVEMIEGLPAHIDLGRLVNDIDDVQNRAIRNIRAVALRPRNANDPEELQLNMQALRDWMADPDNKALLGMFPKSLEDDLKNADSAYELLMGTRAQAAQEQKAAKDRLAFKTLVARADETPSETIRSALTSTRPLIELNQLVKTIDDATDVPAEKVKQAREALKSGIIDWALAKGKNSDNDTIKPTRIYDALFSPPPKAKSDATVADWMISNNLLGKSEADTIKQYLAQMRTYQGLLNGNELEALMKDNSPLKDLALRVMGAKVGTAMAGAIGGSESSLIAAAAGSRALRALFLSKSSVNNMRAFKYLMENPAELSRLLKTPRNEREATTLWQRGVDFMIGRGFALARRSSVAGQDEFRPPMQMPEQQQEQPENLDQRLNQMQQQSMQPIPQPRQAQAIPMPQAPRPTAPMSMAPPPQPAPPPAMPNPQQRQQYAALFPNDPMSDMIKGGIGSLA